MAELTGRELEVVQALAKLPTEQFDNLIKFAALSYDELMVCMEVAKNEIVRVVVYDKYVAATRDRTVEGAAARSEACAILRKMYAAHKAAILSGETYPWNINDLVTGVVDETALKAVYDTKVDPAPGSEVIRTPGT